MLQRTSQLLKKKFTLHPGFGLAQGAKNPAWNRKIPAASKPQFHWAFTLESPGRYPKAWSVPEAQRLGMVAWPKAVGFYNAGDNFELSSEMQFRLFRRYHNHELWTPEHSERAMIALFPEVEHSPKEGLSRINEIFRCHVERFGADHIAYNAAMQARGFAKDYDGARALLVEMERLGLEPNAQSYFNMIFAVKMAGKPKSVAEEHFQRAISTGAMSAVMRLDTEFEMWWSQLERMGSFTSTDGHLAVNEEGAKPLPQDPFAIWGWDRSERKFVTEREAVTAEVKRRTRSDGMTGTVFNSVLREPWFKYRGFKPHDYKGPSKAPSSDHIEARAPAKRRNPYARHA